MNLTLFSVSNFAVKFMTDEYLLILFIIKRIVKKITYFIKFFFWSTYPEYVLESRTKKIKGEWQLLHSSRC